MDEIEKNLFECMKRTFDAIDSGTFVTNPPTFDDLIQKERVLKRDEEKAQKKAKLEYEKEWIDNEIRKWENDIEEF